MSGLCLDPDSFADGTWIDRIPTLLERPRAQPSTQNGAETVAKFLVELCLIGDGATLSETP